MYINRISVFTAMRRGIDGFHCLRRKKLGKIRYGAGS